MEYHEKRKFSRILFDAPVIVMLENRKWESSLIDISLNGMLIEKPDDWVHDLYEDFYDVQVLLEEGSETIRMHAHVAHQESSRIGFQCDYINLDSIARLKRLVELNMQDSSNLERELENLAVA